MMNSKRLANPLAWLFLAMALLMSGCMLSAEQRSRAEAAVQKEYEAGNITVAQRDAAVEAIRNSGDDWIAVLEGLGTAGINIILALIGAGWMIRRTRGPSTQKVGLPAEKVHGLDQMLHDLLAKEQERSGTSDAKTRG